MLMLARDAEPGEFSSDADAQYNAAQNEKKYVELFGAALATAGMPNHAIVDTGKFLEFLCHLILYLKSLLTY